MPSTLCYSFCTCDYILCKEHIRSNSLKYKNKIHKLVINREKHEVDTIN